MSGSDSEVLDYETVLADNLSEETTYEAHIEIPVVLPAKNFVWHSRIAEQNSTADYHLDTIIRQINFSDLSRTVFQGVQENADVDDLLFKILAQTRFQEIKRNFFEVKNKESRIQRALAAFDKVKAITGLNADIWKTIAEDEGISDQYGE